MRVLDDAIAAAPDTRLQARARVEREFVRLETDTSPGIERSARVAEDALPMLADDAQGQSRAWSLRAQVAWNAGRIAQADDAWRAAAERAGDERELFDVLRWRATAAVLGPTPVNAAIARCEAFGETVSASPVAVAWTLNALAVLYAMRGDFELAERTVGEANATLSELGSLWASVSHHEAYVWLLAGRFQLAEVPLRAGVEKLSALGDTGLLATTTAMLAQAVHAQGRTDEAAGLCRATAATAAADDIVTQVIWRGVQAKLDARAGDCERAEQLAREAIALVEPTDLLSHHGDAMLDLAEVLRMCSRADEARGAVEAGVALYELKGNAAAATRARTLLEG